MAKERQSPMLKSVTGFGRYEVIMEEYKIPVEMKAVNHRHLDLSIKMPKKLNHFEAGIRNLSKNYIQRGRADVFINYEDCTENKLYLKYNSSLAVECMDYFKKMEEQFGIANDVEVSTLPKMPEVLIMEQAPEDEEHMWKLLFDTIEEAVKKFAEACILEGGSLWDDSIGKLDYMTGLVTEIETRSPEPICQYREKPEDKAWEMFKNDTIDDNRIVTEMTTFADEVCVDEETVRLQSHIEHTREELLVGGSIGRKLDFIAQEMNREANTILSKASDLETSDRAVALKAETEKVREQTQNIE